MPTNHQIAELERNPAWAWFLESLKEQAGKYREQFESVDPEDSIGIARIQARIQEIEEILESPLKGI